MYNDSSACTLLTLYFWHPSIERRRMAAAAAGRKHLLPQRKIFLAPSSGALFTDE
jgi:hypothetical protein